MKPQTKTTAKKGVTVEGLASHLQELETQQMGLRTRPAVNRRVAKALLDLTA